MYSVCDNGSCEKSIVGNLNINQCLSVGRVEWTHTHAHTNTIIGALTKAYCCYKLCVCYLWCLMWYFTLNFILLPQRIMPTNYLMTVICCPLCFCFFYDFVRWSQIWLYRCIKCVCFMLHFTYLTILLSFLQNSGDWI